MLKKRLFGRFHRVTGNSIMKALKASVDHKKGCSEVHHFVKQGYCYMGWGTL